MYREIFWTTLKICAKCKQPHKDSQCDLGECYLIWLNFIVITRASKCLDNHQRCQNRKLNCRDKSKNLTLITAFQGDCTKRKMRTTGKSCSEFLQQCECNPITEHTYLSDTLIIKVTFASYPRQAFDHKAANYVGY